MRAGDPSRGEIWFVDLDPTKGHEQAGRRPVVVVSVDPLNHGPADLLIVVPVTSKRKNIPSHVPIKPPEGGLRVESYALCEAVRSISKQRVVRKLGTLTSATMREIEDVLRLLMGL